eukprot:55648-Eustigmatos_ZCMA.PRE.1
MLYLGALRAPTQSMPPPAACPHHTHGEVDKVVVVAAAADGIVTIVTITMVKMVTMVVMKWM